jgi:hypothetical protein
LTDLASPRAPFEILAQRLNDAGIPVEAVSGNVSAAVVTYAAHATQAQRDEGDAMVAAFDWTLAAEKQAEATAATNERTIGDALLAALQSNQQAIATLTTWRTTGAGAGTANLTAAQSSLALRQMADNQIAQLRQLNGLIRLVKRNLSTADLSSAIKA